MIKLFIGLLLISPIQLLAYSDEYQKHSSIDTELGKLEVLTKIKPECCSAPQYLAFNGEIFYEEKSTDLYLNFIGAYKTKDEVAVLLEKSCGGSGCRVHPLSFIRLKANMRPTFVTDENFFSDSLIIEPTEHADKVEVNLGYEDQKQKTAILTNGILTITLTKSDVTELSDENCGELYQVADACVQSHNLKLKCHSDPNYTIIGSNAQMWVEHRIKNYPGFNRDGLNKECIHACETGELNNYEIFKESACKSKGSK